MTEKVLVVRANVLDDLDLDGGFAFDVESDLKKIFQSKHSFFLDRQVAEASTEYKQVIPYVVLCAALRVCTYLRGSGSGEPRLEGKRSIGFGGHIVPHDRRPSDLQLSWYLRAVRREVCEEVGISAPRQEEVLGLIMDDQSAVGRVHVGILHLWEVPEEKVRSREEQIRNVAFMTLRELSRRRDELEPWSRRTLEVLNSALQSGVSEPRVEDISLFELAKALRRRALSRTL